MARRTRKTIRRHQPLARELIKLANDLHRINARLLVLAERVDSAEADSIALQRFMVTVNKSDATSGEE